MAGKRKMTEVRTIDAADIPGAAVSGMLSTSQRVTRAMRLARAQLAAAAEAAFRDRPESARWFCLEVESGRDFAVEKRLADAGVEVLVPRQIDHAIRRGKKIEVIRPLLPGYVLAHFIPSAAAFTALRRQKGVREFVRNGETYLVVGAKDVVAFQAHEPIDTSRLAADKSIVAGTRCRVSSGPFTGWACLVTAVKFCREPRASIVISFGGNSLPVRSIPLAFLEKL